MNEINKQVRRAKRRMMTGQFFRILSWALFAGLIIATIGMVIPKVWYLAFMENQLQRDAWIYSWVLGGAVTGLITTAIFTYQRWKPDLDVAVEVDKRFGLKERISSAMSLPEKEIETNAGRALVEDAEDRAGTIDVRDEFRFQPTWRAFMPLIPAAILLLLLFVPNATQKEAIGTEPEKLNRKQIEVAIKEFKKKKEEKRDRELAKGLKDSPELNALEKKFDQLLEDKNVDKKDALIKLNDIKKQIADRQRQLGDSKSLKENLNKLKDVSSGPAKELSNALSEGNMDEAKKAIKDLVDKLRDGKMSDVEKKKLAKDLDAMARELEKLMTKHEQQKKELEDKIKKALEKGDLDKAAKLQQQLDQKKQQDKQMQKMQKMAENLKKCANCMKPGANGQPKQGGKKGESKQGEGGDQQAKAMQDAADSLEDMMEQIEKMQGDMDEMEELEDMEKLAGECKGNMNGQQMDMPPKFQDWAKGAGNGHGKREKEEEKTGGYKARVKGQPQQGETVVTDNADGANITGRSTSETRELVQAEMSKESDPLENQKLPKSQREHAQQYFESLRKNE